MTTAWHVICDMSRIQGSAALPPVGKTAVRERKESAVLPVGPSSPPTEKITSGAGDWREDAACRGIESSVFFPPDGERGHARARREARARRSCQDCPVFRRCRDHALAAGNHTESGAA